MDIVVDQVTKIYGMQKAIDTLSFSVKTGEVLGFLGPNGAGKSTTMKAITCYLSPNEGDIKVGGLSVKESPDEVKKHIGYLPENNPLYFDMPVIDYLKFAAELQGVPPELLNERVVEMVKICGLKDEKHKKIRELSKGYRQRVGLAQALIHDPEVLVLDEPTTGLDPNQIVEIRELIRKIGREKTVILSSHILAEVEATCDRILIINKGKIVADGSPEQLRKRAKGNEILRLQIPNGDNQQIFDALKALPTVLTAECISPSENRYEIHSKDGMNSAQAIFNLCVENEWYISEMIPTETKLEDIFREVTMN